MARSKITTDQTARQILQNITLKPTLVTLNEYNQIFDLKDDLTSLDILTQAANFKQQHSLTEFEIYRLVNAEPFLEVSSGHIKSVFNEVYDYVKACTDYYRPGYFSVNDFHEALTKLLKENLTVAFIVGINEAAEKFVGIFYHFMNQATWQPTVFYGKGGHEFLGFCADLADFAADCESFGELVEIAESFSMYNIPLDSFAFPVISEQYSGNICLTTSSLCGHDLTYTCKADSIKEARQVLRSLQIKHALSMVESVFTKQYTAVRIEYHEKDFRIYGTTSSQKVIAGYTWDSFTKTVDHLLYFLQRIKADKNDYDYYKREFRIIAKEHRLA